MKDEYYTELVVLSQTLNPEQLNAIVGMNCDKSRLAGASIGSSLIRARKNTWIIYSRLPRDLHIENHIEDLLKRVSPITDKIRRLADQPDVEVVFGCVIYTREQPAMDFNREQVAAICDLGARIDIDLYFLPRRRKNIITRTDPI
jgi:hypothetical protein